MLFEDTFYPTSVATPIKATLARVPMEGARATLLVPNLAAGTHLISATHEDSGTTAVRVQIVNAPGGPSVVAVEQVAKAAKQRAFFTPPAYETRHR